MLRLWKDSYTRRVRTAPAGALSAVVHAVLITAWVRATLPPAAFSSESLANRVYYIPPVDKPRVPLGARETVRYISLVAGDGAGPGPAVIDARLPVGLAEHSRTAGPTPEKDTTAAPQPAGSPRGDSVFTVLEVDSAVVRSETSAAPAYPIDLLNKHIEGSVTARYVVDTTGFADPASFEVMGATNSEFVSAVRDALPYMRFSPAKLGTRKVRQLVQQAFTFRIAPSLADVKKP
jgi:hypothetical protein